jgi:hypothetical protein
MRRPPTYTHRDSQQTLGEGLAEYYVLNPHITRPETQPPGLARVLQAHDVGHVIYGCDTSMYDELRILPLFWWTSECTFKQFQALRADHKLAIDLMYRDMIQEKGELWLYSEVIRVLPRLVPELVSIWLKTRGRSKRVPFFEFDALLDNRLLEIRQEFDLLSLFK